MVTGSGGGTSTGRSLSKPTIDHPEVAGGCQLTLGDLQLEISDTCGDIARCLGLSHKFRNKLGGKDVVGQCEGCDRFRRTHRKHENRELRGRALIVASRFCMEWHAERNPVAGAGYEICILAQILHDAVVADEKDIDVAGTHIGDRTLERGPVLPVEMEL